MRNAGSSASFVFELDAYCVNGIRGPRERERRARTAARRSASRRARARGCRAGRTRSPSRARRAACPTCRSSRARDTPGMYSRTRPGRTCRRAGSRTRSARSSGCARGSRRSRPTGPHAFRSLLDRHVAVRPLAVDDALRADDAGVADVDHVRVAVVVLRRAKAGAERGQREQKPHGPDGASRESRVP